jgi:hypothetical protein
MTLVFFTGEKRVGNFARGSNTTKCVWHSSGHLLLPENSWCCSSLLCGNFFKRKEQGKSLAPVSRHCEADPNGPILFFLVPNKKKFQDFQPHSQHTKTGFQVIVYRGN